MLEAPGAGLAAPQIGVGLRVFTWHVEGEVGHLVNPVLDLSEETQDGAEGCLSIPGLTIDCRRALCVVAKGFSMHGEPVTIEGSELLARAIQHETDHLDGVLFLDRLDAANRKLAMKAIRESEWFGLEQPTVKVSPHAPGGFGLGLLSALMRVVFAGTPEPALPAPRARSPASAHELVGVVTRPDAPAGRGRRLTPRRSRRAPPSSASPSSSPAHPRDPEFQEALRALAPGLLPGRRVRRAAPAVRARHPAARLGQPALLGAAGLARRRTRAARPLGRRRGHRRDDLPDRRASSTPGRRTA